MTTSSITPFGERLLQGPMVLDGAMGTLLHEHGMTLDQCLEMANLERPEWVLEIHRSFLEAGSHAIQTNTFGANPYRLARHRVAERLEEILLAAARIAREAADNRAYVLGSMGPLGVELEPVGRVSKEEARDVFRRVGQILAPEVDGISLETFGNLGEAVEALRGLREATDLPILAHVSVHQDDRTLRGESIAEAAHQLEDAGANAIGINCSSGPRSVLEAAMIMIESSDLPVSARPNAGMPRAVEGRLFFENNPDYFARFARRFLQAGGRLLGGCCGTTPDHIRAVTRAVAGVTAQEISPSTVKLRSERTGPEPLQPLPLAKRTKLGKALAEGEFPVSIELVPPRTPDMGKLIASAQQLKDAGANCINIPDGPRATARVSNSASAVIVQREIGIETLPHFCCRDRNLLGMQSDLMGMAALDLHNILIVTGDPPYQGDYPDVTAVFDVDSIGLCNIADHLNHGLDLGGNPVGCRTDFCIGAALGHTSVDLDRELSRFAWKVKAGIDFAITQPVFDAQVLLDFLARIEGPCPPILAGIWPLRSLKNAEFLASEVPGVVVPDEVIQRMEQADAQGRGGEEGLAIAQDVMEALAHAVQGFQIAAPFNKVEPALALLEKARALAP